MQCKALRNCFRQTNSTSRK